MRYTLTLSRIDTKDDAIQAIISEIGYTDYSSGGGVIGLELKRKPTDDEVARLRKVIADQAVQVHGTPIEQDFLDDLDAVIENAAYELECAGKVPSSADQLTDAIARVASELRTALVRLRNDFNPLILTDEEKVLVADAIESSLNTLTQTALAIREEGLTSALAKIRPDSPFVQ